VSAGSGEGGGASERVGEGEIVNNMRFRACPRCRGALYFAIDQYGTYWDCVACGHLIYVDTKMEEEKPVIREPPKRSVRLPMSSKLGDMLKKRLKRRWRM
jgi:DNA-directed RNA polymerase subunit M/transcription elongation factor TFIIS